MQFLKLTHNSWSDDLLKVLSTMRSLNEMCDLKLILQSETVVAHSCVLAAASPFFKTILSGTENPEINLESFPSRIVMYMLDFIYTGTVFFPRDDLDILHSVASTLNIPSLRDLTQEMKMHCLPEDLKENDYDSISSHPTLELEHNNKEVLMQQPQENDRLTSRERLSDSLQTVSDNSNLSLTMNLANMVGTLEPLDETVDNNEQIQNADSPTAIQIYVKDEDTTESDVQEMICFKEDSAEPHITENDPNKEFHTVEDGQASYTSVLKKEIFDPQITRRQHKRAVPSALITIEDKPVPADGSISDRAIQTLPDGLFLDVSSINKTVNGIFTRQLFPKGALFGPYEGEILQEITLSNNFLMQYCWKIYRDGKLVHWLSGQNESLANWMRYVQHANNPQQQNLEAFQHHGQLFFRAIRDIQQYSELAVKYGNNQSSVLGTANNHENLLDVSCAQYGETDVFRCEKCDILYTSEVIYYKHMHIKHSQSLPLHVYVQTDKERNTCLAAEQNKEQNIGRPVTGSKMASGITRTRYSSRCQRKNEQGNIRKTERLTLHCEVCKKVFTSLGNLQKHKLIHSNERPYVCPTCGRAFVQKSNMKAHMKIHNDEKHHVCSNCGKRFCRRTELRRHEKFHSTETPYLCSVCNRGFKSIGNLKRHQICHTGEKPYKCSICHKDFNRVENLKTHMRRHTGEKPFQCTLCGNCFTENAHLRIHMRRHSGEKPYVCSVCSKSFVDATTLRVHSKVHHKEQCLMVQAS